MNTCLTKNEMLQIAKPLLFNTEMVRAMLDGRKTSTKRLIKFPVNRYTDKIPGHDNVSLMEFRDCKATFHEQPFFSFDVRPPCRAGDILYVRETIWQKTGHYLDVDGETKGVFCHEYKYVATDKEPETGWNNSWVKRPSIHMPKEAARIFLRVRNVCAERLQNITEEQAKAEGALMAYEVVGFGEKSSIIYQSEDNEGYYVIGFKSIWNSTIKKEQFEQYGWNANPWVWTIQFDLL